MSFYLQKADRYINLACDLYAILPEDKKEEGAELIARLVNAGVVCVPRACQSTVRLNIVNRITTNLPIDCSLKEVTNEETGKSYKALIVTPRETS